MTQAIMAACKNAMDAADVSQTDLSRHMGVADSTVSRRMNHLAFPSKAGGVDFFVTSVSSLTNVPSEQLWRDALAHWDYQGAEVLAP